MWLRFRKSIKIAPGVKLNINKKSCSVTVGKRGAHYTINSKGKHTASVGIPGTGLSYTHTSSGSKKNLSNKKLKEERQQELANKINTVSAKMYRSEGYMRFCKYFHLITGIFFILVGLILTVIIPVCIIFPIIGIFSLFLSHSYSKQLKYLVDERKKKELHISSEKEY